MDRGGVRAGFADVWDILLLRLGVTFAGAMGRTRGRRAERPYPRDYRGGRRGWVGQTVPARGRARAQALPSLARMFLPASRTLVRSPP